MSIGDKESGLFFLEIDLSPLPFAPDIFLAASCALRCGEFLNITAALLGT